MYHDVRTMFQWTNQIWSAERIINGKRQTMLMCDFSNRINIRNVAVWISKCLDENSCCIILNRSFYFFKVMNIYKCCFNTIQLQRMC